MVLPAMPAPAAITPSVATVHAAPAGENEEVLAAVQATLDKRAAALIAKDQPGFEATIDANAKALRRYNVDQFNSLAGRGFYSYQAVRAKAMPGDLFKVWLRNNYDLEAVWVFRQVNGNWLLTEPTEKELGKRIVKETEHFRFRHFEWDTDNIEQTAATLERAYAKVVDALGFAPPDKAFVYVTPALALNPALQRPGVVASANTEDHVINMHAVESYGARAYDPAVGPYEDMFQDITHEYTHVVNYYLVPLSKMKAWMYEGVAEYTSGSFNTSLVSQAIQRNRVLTLEQAHEAIFFKEEKGYNLNQIVLGYGIGSYATRYIYETWGGDAFWNIAREYAKSQNMDQAMQTVIGISYADLQSQFTGWLPGVVKADLAKSS